MNIESAISAARAAEEALEQASLDVIEAKRELKRVTDAYWARPRETRGPLMQTVFPIQRELQRMQRDEGVARDALKMARTALAKLRDQAVLDAEQAQHKRESDDLETIERERDEWIARAQTTLWRSWLSACSSRPWSATNVYCNDDPNDKTAMGVRVPSTYGRRYPVLVEGMSRAGYGVASFRSHGLVRDDWMRQTVKNFPLSYLDRQAIDYYTAESQGPSDKHRAMPWLYE